MLIGRFGASDTYYDKETLQNKQERYACKAGNIDC